MIATAAVGLTALLASGVVPAAAAAESQGQARASAHPVIVIGIGGLRWSDITAATTPAIWRLAGTGSAGTLATTTIWPVTCPADAWLTLNSGARASGSSEQVPTSGPCPGLPSVERLVLLSHTAAGPARIPAMPGLIQLNRPFSYSPWWGLLGSAAGAGRCATAIGPGAALALANPAGDVPHYLPALPSASRSASGLTVLRQCPLTVIDLGALPPPAAASGSRPRASAIQTQASRAVALSAADRAVGGIVAAAPPGAIVVLASTGDEPGPHLGVVVVNGPGYRNGLLTSTSTRQPGVVVITDLTPSIFSWRHARFPAPPAGTAAPTALTLTAVGRGSLAAAVKAMIGQDTADQVYRSIVGWFFLFYGVAEAVLFALIALALRGGGAQRVRRRVAWYSAAAVFTGAVPVGTFLAGLLPWEQWPHPGLLLYGLGFAWAAVIAVVAMAGPWRRDPFGPPGFTAAVTLAVIAIDVMTGSRLQIGAPFGLSLLEAGRFYGVGNNAVCIYATAGILTATWAAAAALRRRPGSRRAALTAAGGVAVASVVVLGWPGFGAKVGGTIALVPAFLVLLAAIAEVRITPRRGLIIGVSGIALVSAFAVLDYLVPAIGASHLGTFVGQVLHGHAGGTLHRKVSSNLQSLTKTWYTPVVPVVAVVTGLMLAWPSRLRLRTFVAACSRSALLRTSLFAVWLAVVLGWLVDDSGVSAAASALPIALPLAIALVVRVAQLPAESGAGAVTVGGQGQAGPPPTGAQPRGSGGVRPSGPPPPAGAQPPGSGRSDPARAGRGVVDAVPAEGGVDAAAPGRGVDAAPPGRRIGASPPGRAG